MSAANPVEDDPPHWRRNLAVCFFGSFTTVLAMSLLLPFLPVYVARLGVSDEGDILRWSGIAYAATFLAAGLVAPLWGWLGDRYGRKPMLIRASLGMAVATALIGLAQDVWQLTALRFLAGLLGGYASGAVILVAAGTPSARTVQSFGILSSGVMAGTLTGPLIGGILPTLIGVRWTFLATGLLIFCAFLMTAAFLREPPRRLSSLPAPSPAPAPAASFRASVPDLRPLIAMLLTALAVLLATMSVEPVLTVYVAGLEPEAGVERVMFVSGLIFSVTALGSLLSAVWIGHLADRIGPWPVVVGSLAVIAGLLVPQAFVTGSWQLLGLRFLMGFGAGGLMASITAVLKNSVAPAYLGRVLGTSTSVQYLGQVLGPLAGGTVGAAFGLQAVFLFSAAVIAVVAVGNAVLYRRS